MEKDSSHTLCSRSSAGFLWGWGLLKQCYVRNVIPTTKSKALYFFRQHAPVPFRRRPSLRITGYGNFLSRLCSLSLFARMSPDDARVNICSFYIYWFREHSLACPSLRSEGSSCHSTALSFDDGYLTRTLQERGASLPSWGTQSFIIETTKESWQWHIPETTEDGLQHVCDRPLQCGTSRCLMVALQMPTCLSYYPVQCLQTMLASAWNSAPRAQRVNLRDGNHIALFYYSICSALRFLFL